VRVAKILCHHFNTSEPAAVVEAINITITDGLYSRHRPLVSFLESKDTVRLNLEGAFARSARGDPKLKNSVYTFIFLLLYHV
jgi:hypothetical protein